MIKWDINNPKDHLLITEAQVHQCNVKLHGLTEGLENASALLVGDWMAGKLNLKQDFVHVIVKVYQIRRPNNPHRQHPRDVLVTLADPRIKIMLLNLTKEKAIWNFKT